MIDRNSTTLGNLQLQYRILSSGRRVEIPSNAPLYNAVTIPDNAPKEVKQIMDVKIPMVGSSSFKAVPNIEMQTKAQLDIAKSLQERGYNPLDYKLDIEELSLKLQQMKAKQEYKNLTELSNTFEQTRKNARGTLRRLDGQYIMGIGCRDCASIDFTETCDRYREATPWYKRIFKPARTNTQNPYTIKIEQKKAILDELATKLSECVFVKERKASRDILFKKLEQVAKRLSK